jgi:hypothetical protein
MTLQHIQGFEHIKPTTLAEVHLEPSDFPNYLGFMTPPNVTDWFIDDTGAAAFGSGPSIVDSDARINGQSILIERPDANTFNADFNGRYAIDMRASIASNAIAAVGFGVKYSKAPHSPIPLVRFLADDGTGAEQQCALWIGVEGQLFMSTTDVGMDSLTVVTPTPIAVTLTEAQTINFTSWTYVEVELNNSAATATITVSVNGQVVMDSVGSSLLRGSSQSNTTSIGVINPQNTYFAADAYDMWADDMYFVDGLGSHIDGIQGPQHMILLQPDGTSQNEWTIVGGEATSYETVDGLFDPSDTSKYLENTTETDEDIFTMENLPASVASVTAVMVSLFAEIDAGSATLQVSLTESAVSSAQSVTVNTLVPKAYSALFSLDPNGANWTPSVVDGLTLSVAVTA